MSFLFSLITDSSLVFGYYQSKIPNGKCIIVATGAPNLMDVDRLRNVDILTEAGYDVMVPDYYGFCRSSGFFSPMNSIQTLIDMYTIAKGSSEKGLQNVYTGGSIKIQYKNITFLGMSYGGGVVLVLPKFLPEATQIGAFYPVIDYRSFGKRGVKEETVEDFLGSIRRGFSIIYRGIDDPVWEKQFRDELGLTPLFELGCMKDASIFLAHGTADVSIFYQKTKEYSDFLKEKFPHNNIVYREYQNGNHGLKTIIPATYEFIGWLDSL